MNEQMFKDRTKKLGLRVIRLVEALPKNRIADVIGKQLLRSATSIGANYRAACRGKSTADMLAKLAVVEEEADESIYLLDGIARRRQNNAGNEVEGSDDGNKRNPCYDCLVNQDIKNHKVNTFESKI